jgi:hypothetical protein
MSPWRREKQSNHLLCRNEEQLKHRRPTHELSSPWQALLVAWQTRRFFQLRHAPIAPNAEAGLVPTAAQPCSSPVARFSSLSARGSACATSLLTVRRRQDGVVLAMLVPGLVATSALAGASRGALLDHA